ncbi:MAG: HEPN domain-containing protein [Rhodocyclaceae bacterium]|nr:MAG: HEPN domain-containing protein [Rhodocyclaceae bacterium]
MAKAIQASVSAKVLLDTGDGDGACNRAYYAMFDAARAALLASGAPVEPEVAKTHSGLISAFSLHLVKTGRVPIELGKSINKVEDLRLIADYKGDQISQEDAAWAVAQAQTFVQAMRVTFISK